MTNELKEELKYVCICEHTAKRSFARLHKHIQIFFSTHLSRIITASSKRTIWVVLNELTYFFLKMGGLLIGFLYKIQSKQVWAKCFSCMKSTFRSEKNRSLWRKVDIPFDFILSTLAYQTTILCDTKYPTLCERAGFPHRSSEHTQSFCLGRFYAVVRISF